MGALLRRLVESAHAHGCRHGTVEEGGSLRLGWTRVDLAEDLGDACWIP